MGHCAGCAICADKCCLQPCRLALAALLHPTARPCARWSAVLASSSLFPRTQRWCCRSVLCPCLLTCAFRVCRGLSLGTPGQPANCVCSATKLVPYSAAAQHLTNLKLSSWMQRDFEHAFGRFSTGSGR